LVCAAMAPACGQRHAPVALDLSLAGDVARVGDVRLPPSLVVAVARTKQMPPRAALEELIEDALLWQEGGSQAGNLAQTVSWELTGAMARSAVARIFEVARQAGRPTTNELSTVTVVHAVVLNSAAVQRENAQAIATSIKDAVEHATSADDFEKRAKSVPHAAVRLTIERIGPFGADGRLPDETRLDPSFVAAAFELPAPGDTSPVVETHYGWHVVRLVERALPEPSSLERGRNDLAEVVVAMRARSRLDRLLVERGTRTKIDVSTAAPALMSRAATRTP